MDSVHVDPVLDVNVVVTPPASVFVDCEQRDLDEFRHLRRAQEADGNRRRDDEVQRVPSTLTCPQTRGLTGSDGQSDITSVRWKVDDVLLAPGTTSMASTRDHDLTALLRYSRGAITTVHKHVDRLTQARLRAMRRAARFRHVCRCRRCRRNLGGASRVRLATPDRPAYKAQGCLRTMSIRLAEARCLSQLDHRRGG